MLTYSVETLRDVYPDIAQYFSLHWDEVAENKDTIPLDVDLDTYFALSDQGVAHAIVARDDGKAVGYMIWVVKPHIRYKSTLVGVADVFFLHPDYRKARHGLGMFQYAEDYMRSLGVDRIAGTCKVAHNLDSLFTGLGWHHVENCYTKVLKE